MTYVSPELARLVRSDAGDLRGYCLCAETMLGIAHEMEHIVPEAAGGETIRENLWIACRRCNSFKSSRCDAQDQVSGKTAPLFHPRKNVWIEHFRWSSDGTLIVGLTASGRATVDALQLNHPLIVAAREMWVRIGVHPPPLS